MHIAYTHTDTLQCSDTAQHAPICGLTRVSFEMAATSAPGEGVAAGVGVAEAALVGVGVSENTVYAGRKFTLLN